MIVIENEWVNEWKWMIENEKGRRKNWNNQNNNDSQRDGGLSLDKNDCSDLIEMNWNGTITQLTVNKSKYFNSNYYLFDP